MQKPKVKFLFLSVILVICTSSYLVFAAKSSNIEAANTILDYSHEVIARWSKISNTLEIPIDAYNGQAFSEITTGDFRALDLIVLGNRIIKQEYKSEYASLGFGDMTDKTFIQKEPNNNLSYIVAGTKIEKLDDLDREYGGIYFVGVPIQVVKEIEEIVNAANKKSKNPILFGQQKIDNTNMVGIFVKYDLGKNHI